MNGRLVSRRRFVRMASAAGACLLGGFSMGCAREQRASASDEDERRVQAEGSADVRAAAGDAGLDASPRPVDGYAFAEGSEIDRGFVVDDAVQTPGGRTLHFSLHVPESYDGGSPYALYVACPGWEGLYFQGAGADLQEDFPFVANDYIEDMIVASPQFDDWGDTSAEDAIALTEWLMGAYNVDPSRVYLSGCSGGGETISIVLGMRPDLYRRALHAISRWDGDIDALAESETPVYIAIGEEDDYYGPEPAMQAYAAIRDAYLQRGLTDERISELAVLDVKPASYFEERGMSANAGQHAGGGALFPHDEEIMGWLFR